MNLPLTIFFILFVVGFVIKLPISITMMMSSIAYFIFAPGRGATVDLVASLFCSQMYVQYVMIAIPMFVFSAYLMNSGKITDKLFYWTQTLVGRWKGGLGHVNVLASLIFSGMTGAANADVAGLGMMEIDAMRKRGYDDGFSCAITAASATIGPIFPPSIPMVLYATTSGVSVGALFLGGITPGVLLAIALMAYVAYIAKKRNYPSERIDITLKSWIFLTIRSIPALLVPIILLMGIYTGFVTATEAGALAGVWALVISFILYRSLDFKEFVKILTDSAKMTGMTAILLGAAFPFSYIITYEKVPFIISQFLLDFTANKFVFLFVINIVFLILGCFMNAIVIMVVFVPVIIPSAQALGIDLVHLGVVIVLNIMIGLSTPPYGSLLFTTSAISGVSLMKIIKEIIPMILVMIVVLLLITYIPEIVLFLPSSF
ncbi:MAG: TRAP transporter large permease [Spirochaetales bacterium]|nr:TRAP transporter large permease [Spirochaetales bacterium]